MNNIEKLVKKVETQVSQLDKCFEYWYDVLKPFHEIITGAETSIEENENMLRQTYEKVNESVRLFPILKIISFNQHLERLKFHNEQKGIIKGFRNAYNDLFYVYSILHLEANDKYTQLGHLAMKLPELYLPILEKANKTMSKNSERWYELKPATE